MRPPRTVPLLEGVVVVVVALLLLSEALLFVAPLAARISATSAIDLDGNGTVRVTTTISSTFDAHVSLSNIVGNGTPSFRTIYYYYDGRYPVSDLTVASDWFGLSQHIAVIASARGLPVTIDYLNADQLAEFFADTTNDHALLVMASGVLPDTVYNGDRNLVVPWIRSGGTLVWAGDAIGAYYGEPIPLTGSPYGGVPVLDGPGRFVPADILEGSATLMGGSSPGSEALGIDYPYALPDYSLNMSVLERMGGLVLGNVGGRDTNIGRIPMGNGTLLDFAAPVSDVIELSRAIVGLLQSRLIAPSYQLGEVTTIAVGAGTTVVGPTVAALPSWAFSNRSVEFCRFTVQDDYAAPFGTLTCVSAG